MTPKPDKQLSPGVVEAVEKSIEDTPWPLETRVRKAIAVKALRAALPLLEGEIRKDERGKTAREILELETDFQVDGGGYSVIHVRTLKRWAKEHNITLTQPEDGEKG